MKRGLRSEHTHESPYLSHKIYTLASDFGQTSLPPCFLDLAKYTICLSLSLRALCSQH